MKLIFDCWNPVYEFQFRPISNRCLLAGHIFNSSSEGKKDAWTKTTGGTHSIDRDIACGFMHYAAVAFERLGGVISHVEVRRNCCHLKPKMLSQKLMSCSVSFH